MRIYVPSVVKHWGDWITTLWACELLKHHMPEAIITLDDTCQGAKTRQWLKFSWTNQLARIDLASSQGTFDYVLATHHRHPFKRSLYPNMDGDRMLFFDAHGLVYRMHVDGWYPTFAPTTLLQQEFDALGLPEHYVAYHLNDISPHVDGRHADTLSQYLCDNHALLTRSANGLPSVSTSFHLPGTINLTNIHGWLKIYVLIRSHEFWGSYTGFTSIASIYRQRIRSHVVNEAGPGIFNLGPPIISYTDYDVASFGSLNALYYAIDADRIKHAKGHEYLKRCEELWRLQCQFENFDVTDFVTPPDGWTRKHVYLDRENCAVPLDATFRKVGVEKAWDYRRDIEMMSLPIQGFKKRQS